MKKKIVFLFSVMNQLMRASGSFNYIFPHSDVPHFELASFYDKEKKCVADITTIGYHQNFPKVQLMEIVDYFSHLNLTTVLDKGCISVPNYNSFDFIWKNFCGEGELYFNNAELFLSHSRALNNTALSNFLDKIINTNCDMDLDNNLTLCLSFGITFLLVSLIIWKINSRDKSYNKLREENLPNSVNVAQALFTAPKPTHSATEHSLQPSAFI